MLLLAINSLKLSWDTIILSHLFQDREERKGGTKGEENENTAMTATPREEARAAAPRSDAASWDSRSAARAASGPPARSSLKTETNRQCSAVDLKPPNSLGMQHIVFTGLNEQQPTNLPVPRIYTAAISEAWEHNTAKVQAYTNRLFSFIAVPSTDPLFHNLELCG